MEASNSLRVSLVKPDLCMGRFIALFTILQMRKKKIQRGQVTCPKSEPVNGHSFSKVQTLPKTVISVPWGCFPICIRPRSAALHHIPPDKLSRSICQEAPLSCSSPTPRRWAGVGFASSPILYLQTQFLLHVYLWQNTEQDFFHWGLHWKQFSQPADV